MSAYFLAISLSVISLLLIIACFTLYNLLKSPQQATADDTPKEPNIENLENALKQLIEDNKQTIENYNLQQTLKTTPANIIASYLHKNPKDLKGFHLFQLIFSLIKNKTEDSKIIKILRHYMPSSSTQNLYALLRSCKEFLNITQKDNTQKELLKDLNQNKLRTTLMYLQQKLNNIFNHPSSTPLLTPQQQIDIAAMYGLIFASFCKFYNPKYSEKILELTSILSPKLFAHWHSVPHKHVPIPPLPKQPTKSPSNFPPTHRS